MSDQKHHRENPVSHTTTVKTLFKNPSAFKKACQKLNLKHRVAEVLDGRNVLFPVKLFQTTETAWGEVHLPGWRYPVVVRDDGKAAFDNYNGNWGNISEYDKFCQAYSVEATIEAAELLGQTVVGVTTDNETGNVVVELSV